MYEKEIEIRMQELPKDLIREVLDYMEFLLSYNTRLWIGDNVLSGYECIFRNTFDEDVVPNAKLLSLPMELYREVVNVRKSLNLDFDDTYQYNVAKHYGSKVVTMDKDFERIRNVEVLFL